MAEDTLIPAGDGSGVAEVLSGRWIRCSGELSSGAEELAFDGALGVESFAADGSSLGHRNYQLSSQTGISSPLYQARLFEASSIWLIEASSRPLKIRIQESGPCAEPSSAVFAALP